MKHKNDIIALGQLLLKFGRIQRGTYHEDGTTSESDAEHTVMLSILACSYAAQHAPHLDVGMVAQFALVHDLVEVYADDTQTLRLLDPDEKKAKDEREKASLDKIEREFGTAFPWLIETIKQYELLSTPEARFIKVLDKTVPKITHILNKGVSVVEQEQQDKVQERYNRQYEEMLTSYGADQPEAMALWKAMVEEMNHVLREE